ncbi:MAG: hypothetical protein K0S32_1040 [Bacteroidetes bacterium]|nr:hypothetical protein [Bacteroidota bacterium]
MKKILPLIIAGIIMVVAITCTNHKEEHKDKKNSDNVWVEYQPIPKGFDYPANTGTLNTAVVNADIVSIRGHAWSLFAGMMQPASNNVNWPVWYTWPNSVDAMRIKEKFCQGETGLEAKPGKDMFLSLIQQNKLHKTLVGTILDTLRTPYYPIPNQVIEMFKNSDVFRNNFSTIIPGKHFLFNGDIMIPTESLSSDAFNWINNNRFYNKSVMDSLYSGNKGKNLNAPSSYIVTKHMYWPVLKGQLNLVPVWKASSFSPDYAGYAGYETWKHFVAIDPGHITNNVIPSKLSYLYNVYNFDTTRFIGPVKVDRPKVYSINDFYYHQITQADWNSFDASDKAILMASSYWAYNKPIGVGDYLVTIASHINTKEIYSWTMQSAWWSDTPDDGPYSKNRPALANAKGPWRHYELVDAYGVPVNNANQLPMASNPYIELVIHPQQTNCNNCHMRAGYPEANSSFVNGASYQNQSCKDLLMKLTEKTSCLQYYMRTDFQWIIPDYTHYKLLCSEKAH